MRHKVPILPILFLLSALAGPASAVTCDVDEVPAATLLLPYFETDLITPGLDTLLLIRNAGTAPLLANLTVWSDLGVPVFSFPIGLAKYDTYSLSLRDVLVNGKIPPSYRGTFKDCGTVLPLPDIPSDLLQGFQDALAGRPSPLLGGRCLGLSLPGRPNVAHGYVTIDTVNRCKFFYDPMTEYFKEYFAGLDKTKTRIIADTNKLLGQSIFVDPTSPTYPMAHAEPLVHIEADKDIDTGYTFYKRLVPNGVDRREPLATNFAVSFAQGGVYGGTDLFVWRDPGQPVPAPFTCGSPPSPFPLDEAYVVAFDEQGGSTIPSDSPFFGAAAQRVDLVDSRLRPPPPPTGDFGWLFLNLNRAPTRNGISQAWVVGVVNSAATSDPIFTASYEAERLDSACTTNRGKRTRARFNAPMPY